MTTRHHSIRDLTPRLLRHPLLMVAGSPFTRLHLHCANWQSQFGDIAVCSSHDHSFTSSERSQLHWVSAPICGPHWFHPSDPPREPNLYSECHVLRCLALLSLGHPLGAFPAPCGNFAALLFRFLPQEISRATNARLRPEAGEISCGCLPKKRHSPLGAGHTRVALRRGVPSEIRAIQIRRKENGTLRKQHPA